MARITLELTEMEKKSPNKRVQWLKGNRWLLASILGVAVFFSQVLVPQWTLGGPASALIVNALMVAAFLAAWVLDRRSLGGREISEREMLLAVSGDLRAYEVPFLLRVGIGPNPLAGWSSDVLDTIRGRHFLDWSFYAPSFDDVINDEALLEVRENYFKQPVSTSTVGVFSPREPLADNFLFIGMVYTKHDTITEIRPPWEWGEQDSISLRPLRLYKYEYRVTGDAAGSPARRNCRVVDSADEVDGEFLRVLGLLFENRRDLDMWKFEQSSDWTPEIARVAAARFEERLVKPERVPVNHLSWKELRRLASKEDVFRLAVFFAGFILSPFSPWNDLVVNVIPSVALGLLTAKLVNLPVFGLCVFYYVFSNVLGLAMMGLSARGLGDKFDLTPSKRQVMNVVIWTVVLTMLAMAITALVGGESADGVYEMIREQIELRAA